MKQQLIYIHGGEIFDSFWAGWKSTILENLKKCFKKKSRRWPDTLEENLSGFEIIRLKMPYKYNAKYEAWKNHFESKISSVEGEFVLLGWSLGANFLVKYLSENTFPKKIKSLHLVAGCFGATGGFELKNSLKKIETQCDTIYLYHSKDDFVVNFSDFEKYQKSLPVSIGMTFKDRNHFLQKEFPELIKNIRGNIV